MRQGEVEKAGLDARALRSMAGDWVAVGQVEQDRSTEPYGGENRTRRGRLGDVGSYGR